MITTRGPRWVAVCEACGEETLGLSRAAVAAAEGAHRCAPKVKPPVADYRWLGEYDHRPVNRVKSGKRYITIIEAICYHCGHKETGETEKTHCAIQRHLSRVHYGDGLDAFYTRLADSHVVAYLREDYTGPLPY